MRQTFPANRGGVAIAALAALTAASASHIANADIIHEQAFDFANGLPSEENTFITIARTADDLVLLQPTILEAFEATFIVDNRIEFDDWMLEIRRDAEGDPGELLFLIEGGIAIDTGLDWDPRGHPELGIFEITWDLGDLSLPAGRYWVSARGVGTGNVLQRAFWGTANTASPHRHQAHFESFFFFVPFWTPWSRLPSDFMLDPDLDFEGIAFDTAWRLDGRPGDFASVHRTKVRRGFPVATEVERLHFSDDTQWIAVSTSDDVDRTPNRMVAVMVLRTDVADPDDLTLRIETAVNQTSGRIVVLMRNWATGEFERVGRFAAPTTERVEVIGGINGSRFVNGRGRIVMLLRYVVDQRPQNAPFFAFIDHVEVGVE